MMVVVVALETRSALQRQLGESGWCRLLLARTRYERGEPLRVNHPRPVGKALCAVTGLFDEAHVCCSASSLIRLEAVVFG